MPPAVLLGPPEDVAAGDLRTGIHLGRPTGGRPYHLVNQGPGQFAGLLLLRPDEASLDQLLEAAGIEIGIQ